MDATHIWGMILGKCEFLGWRKRAIGGVKSRDVRICRIARFLLVCGVVIHCVFEG